MSIQIYSISIDVTIDGNSEVYCLVTGPDIDDENPDQFSLELKKLPCGEVEHYFQILDSGHVFKASDNYSLDPMTRRLVCDRLSEKYGENPEVVISIGGQRGTASLCDFMDGTFKLSPILVN